MDFYEIGVYLVIVIVASTSVFGVMFLLIRSMTPKRRKSKRSMALIRADGAGKPVKNTGKNGKSKSKGKKDNLLELKEYPESKILPLGDGSKNSEKSAKGKADSGKDQKDKHQAGEDNRENEKVLAAAAGGATGSGAESAAPEASNPEGATQEGGEMTLPDLPSMDTLTEEEQEMPKEEIDLMSVFESEDAEDSSTSDLAANLFDVDVGNIEKLGSEVSQFLSGMR